MQIAVIDGQGGGLGRALVDKLVKTFPEAVVLALGTNAAATEAMRKAGAHISATGENAICYNAARADVIVGGAGIIAANAMHGELSPAMAAAVAQSDALKVLIPLNRCNLRIAGVATEKLSELLDSAVALIAAQENL